MARWGTRTVADAAPPALPLPPLEFRQWVGPLEDERYDNPTGAPIYPEFPPERYESVLDFGCGCGRVARQLIQQRPRPRRYVGVDVHPALIAWCQEHLAPYAPGFSFHHHDVHDALVNAGPDKPAMLALPADDGSVTFFEALSIFTHIVESQLPFYLGEAARVLRADGEMNASFLLFDARDFPALGGERHALYIDPGYAPAGVYYDREWLQRTVAEAGLAITRITQQPEVRGYQWRVALAPLRGGATAVELPADENARGVPRDLAGRAAS